MRDHRSYVPNPFVTPQISATFPAISAASRITVVQCMADGTLSANFRHALQSPECRCFWHRREPHRRRSRLQRSHCRERCLSHRRSAGCSGAGEPRPRPRCDQELRLPDSAHVHHHQPGARGYEEGGRRIRSSDRGGDSRRLWRSARGRRQPVPDGRRTGARRERARCPGNFADCDSGAREGNSESDSSHRQRCGSCRSGRRECVPGLFAAWMCWIC